MKKVMRNILISTSLLFVCFFAAETLADQTRWVQADDESGSVTIPFQFEDPVFVMNTSGDQEVSIKGLTNTIEAGFPKLPYKTYKIALPQNTEMTDVTLKEGTHFNYKAKLVKAGAQTPVMEKFFAHAIIAEIPEVIGNIYPEQRVQTNVQKLHGVSIVIVTFFPLSEDRNNESVGFLKDGEIQINYIQTAQKNTTHALRPHQEELVGRFVDNPNVLKSYTKLKANNLESYDYLIISVDTFINYQGEYDFKALQNGLLKRGLTSRIANVKDIQNSTAGSDLGDKIRNYIQVQYKQYGIRFVLLAGDGDTSGSGNMIPARKFWSKIRGYNGQWMWIEEHIPADLYYGCLDGPFNGNGNSKWGEPTDGANGGDVDLLAEVAVGRMPMKKVDELKNIIRKTLWIYNNPVEKNVFLLGETLFEELHLTGGTYMDQLVGQCTDHKYTTNGYGTDWTLEKLYDENGREWYASEAFSNINKINFSMINHLGHSNTTYNMRMSTYEIDDFRNAKPFFYYTQGCFPGDFTANECFIELLVRHTNGAVASIANTSYGLGPEDPAPNTTETPGASQMLHRRFINAIFSEHVVNLGRANQVSKEEFIGLANTQEIRWVMWDANYFGDPSLELKY